MYVRYQVPRTTSVRVYMYKVLSDFCPKVVWKLSVPEYICLKNLGVLPSYCLSTKGVLTYLKLVVWRIYKINFCGTFFFNN